MNHIVFSKTYDPPEFCRREILRYANCKESDDNVEKLLDSCIKELEGKLVYKVCYCELKVNIRESICSFDVFDLFSKNLAENMNGAERAVLFAATVGIEIDRLIAKYGRISPSRALFFQAIGAERIEALCDTFCRDVSVSMNIRTGPRFSPGYGDLSIECQKDIFDLLDCPKRIGLSLNDSMIMSPSKSVTALFAVFPEE